MNNSNWKHPSEADRPGPTHPEDDIAIPVHEASGPVSYTHLTLPTMCQV